MSLAARTDTIEQRTAIYARLTRRNRLVRLLRIGLPVIGGIVLAGLVLQIYVGSLIPDFGFANITIDRDNLIVEAPVYTGVSGDGAVYTVSAAAARTRLGATDRIDLNDAIFVLEQTDGSRLEAKGAVAQLLVADEVVVVDGIATVEGTDGLSGTVIDAEVDVGAETLHSKGAVDLTLRDANVTADSMHYDGATSRWTFYNATLNLNATPGETAAGLRPSVGLAPETQVSP